MKSLQDLQTGYQEKTTALGQLSVQRILLNQQIESLEQSMETVEKEYKTLQQTERDLVKKLNDKYGPGQLDPATGVFTPTT
jgi:prefoldin subunit 5